MMRRLKLLYPFLFVILPILDLLSRNPGGFTLGDAGELMLVMVAATTVLYGVAVLALSRERKEVAALAVLAAIIWFYSYPAVRSAYHLSQGNQVTLGLMVVLLITLVLGTVAGIWWLQHQPGTLQRVATFFTVTGLLLVAISSARIAVDQLQAQSQLRASVLVKQLNRPITVKEPVRRRVRRDVYLVVMDEYANSSVLEEHFDFDNHVFVDSLRKLGFIVPRLVRSNYATTVLSLPSLLNFSHLQRLEFDVGRKESDPTIPNYLVANNRTVAFLKSQGYQFVLFPSQWWLSTRHSRHADWEFQVWKGFDLRREATRSDMRRAFVGGTPLALLKKSDRQDADHVKRTLQGLEQLPAGGPTFALVHILNPHYPYVFDADCRPYDVRPGSGWGGGRKKVYVQQVKCLNSLVLRTVTQVLRRSHPRPIILLLGDHGTPSLGYSTAKSAQTVSPAQAQERFGAFGAFYLPEGGERVVADTVTLVNVMPLVLNYYFGTGIEVAPNNLYMSLEKAPYLFAPVEWSSLSLAKRLE